MGISCDNVPTNIAFGKHLGGLSYPLLSDFYPHGEVAQKFGVLRTGDPLPGISERAVFVVDKQRAVQRRVVVGLGDDEVVEIREGVKAGESLVTTGYETLVDGARVRVSSS